MLMPAALTSTRTSPVPGTGRGTSRTSRTSMPPYESNCTAFVMNACGSALGHGRSDRREVGHHSHLGEHGTGHHVAVERLDLAVAEVPEVGGRDVDLRSRRLDDAGRGLQRPEEAALNRQLDGDRVSEHVDAVQLPMDIGEELGDAEYRLAEVLAPIALLADSARFSASVPQGDHAVRGEAADKPGDVQDAALRRVVGVPDDCFIVVRHLALLIRCVECSPARAGSTTLSRSRLN